MNRNDAYLQKLLSTTTYNQEALSWLRKPDGKERTIGDGGQDAATSLRLVKNLYKRGAIDVTAIDIETDTHLETTSTLIVKLPQEASARKRVFQTEATISREGGFDAVGDEGQHYLMLHW